MSRYGKTRLGGPESQPEFGYLAWFAMLFSAGMGIGLVFWSVAEPILHYQAPPNADGGTAAAAGQAMVYTFFHWGLHAWAVYVVLGMSVAYFSFRHGLPLTVRSVFYPVLGETPPGKQEAIWKIHLFSARSNDWTKPLLM